MAPRPFPSLTRTAALSLTLVGALLSCSEPDLRPAEGQLEVAFEAESTAFSGTARLKFGEVFAGLRAERRLLLRNFGRSEIVITELATVSGPVVSLSDAPDAQHPFSLHLPAGTRLAAGEQLAVVARFAASGDGFDALPVSLASTLRLTTGEGSRKEDVVQVEFSATLLPDGCALPEALDFGAVAVGTQATRSFTLKNPSSTSHEAQLGPPEPRFAEGRFFAYVGGVSGARILPAGTSEDVEVGFAPTFPGPFSATISVRPAPQCPEVSVQLQGVGVDRLLTWEPAHVDCGWVAPGLSVERKLSFTNEGTSPYALSGFKVAALVEDGSERDFILEADSWGDEYGFTLAPGETAERIIHCAPSVLGERKAKLAFASDAPGLTTGEVCLSASGGGPDIEVPQELEFDKAALVSGVGVPQRRHLRVWNRGAAPSESEAMAALKLGTEDSEGDFGEPRVRVTPLNDSTSDNEFHVEFPQSYQPQYGIFPAPSENWVDLVVHHTPRSTGAKAAKVTLLSNDPDEPEVDVIVTSEVSVYPACNYRLSSSELEFGVVHSTNPRKLALTVENLGNAPGDVCLISYVGLSPWTPADYSLEEGTIPFELPPGGQQLIEVELKPARLVGHSFGPVSGMLELSISSLSTPHPDVPLRGGAGPACLAFQPSEMNFGTLPPGAASDAREVRFINLCAGTMQLHGASLVGGFGNFALELQAPIPDGGVEVIPDTWAGFRANGHIAPNTVPFVVRYVPTSEGVHRGAVIVDVEQMGQRLKHVLPLQGRADSAAVSEDAFVQGGGDPVDIVVAVTDSLVFGWSLENLSSQAGAFISHLNASGNDFHLGVLRITDDLSSDPQYSGYGRMGQFVADAGSDPDRILKAGTGNAAQQLEIKVLPSNGSQSDGDTDLLYYHLWRALVPPHSTGTNAGFLRETARLAIIYVTPAGDGLGLVPPREIFPKNLPDGGPLWPDAPQFLVEDGGDFVRVLLELKGAEHPERLSYAALTNFRLHDPGNCTWQTDWASAPLYSLPHVVVAAATRGWLGESCPEFENEWPALVEGLAEVASGLKTRFPLSTLPDLSTASIEVLVDGVSRPALDSQGQPVWAYEANGNQVRFELAQTPRPGSRVLIRYPSLVP